MTRLRRRNALVLLFLVQLMQHHITVTHIIVNLLKKKSRRVRRRRTMLRTYTMIERVPHQSFRLDRLYRDSDIDCIEQMRMDRNAFGRLCFLMSELCGLSESKYVTVEEQLAIFLSVLAHHKKVRVVKFDFWRSGQTISHYVHIVLKALLKMHTILIVRPTPVPSDSSNPTWRWFKGCLGALDGIHLPVHVPATEQARFRDRNGKYTTNVLGVCDQNANFVYVLPGWEGSAADGRVLRNAVNRPHGLKVPLGHYYLCDQAYANSEGFLVPYRGARYHNDVRGLTSSRPTNHVDHFNMRHTRARNIIERAFGILKKRFSLLQSPFFYPLEVQMRLIMACFLLHNFIRSITAVDPFEEMLDNDPLEQDGDDYHDDFVDMVQTSAAWTQFRDDLSQEIFTEWAHTS